MTEEYWERQQPSLHGEVRPRGHTPVSGGSGSSGVPDMVSTLFVPL